MCPKNEEQSHSIDESVIVNNKQKKPCGDDGANLSTSDNQNVDFHLNTTNQENIMCNTRIKLWMFMHGLLSIASVFIASVIIYKLYTELMQMQSKILLLNERIESLRHMYEHKFVDTIIERDGFNNHWGEDAAIGKKPLARKLKKESVNANADVDNTDGALAAHFKGTLPEIRIKDQGLIGPWYADNMVSRQYKFPKFHLTEGKCSIEVTEPALYFIYAQVYYITTSSSVNSYAVYVRSEGSSENNVIAKCSVVAPNNSHISEISCYTGTIYSLDRNDRIFIQQTEKNRTIILRDGHSFFGLVRLNNSQRNK